LVVQIISTLRELGMEVLVNQVKYPLGQGLAFVGLGDIWLGDFAPKTVLDSLPPSEPRIVPPRMPHSSLSLSHTHTHTHILTQRATRRADALQVLSHHPDTANALRKWRVDLQVSVGNVLG
jgi:predicted MPP superfamily phosphohydrolase